MGFVARSKSNQLSAIVAGFVKSRRRDTIGRVFSLPDQKSSWELILCIRSFVVVPFFFSYFLVLSFFPQNRRRSLFLLRVSSFFISIMQHYRGKKWKHDNNQVLPKCRLSRCISCACVLMCVSNVRGNHPFIVLTISHVIRLFLSPLSRVHIFFLNIFSLFRLIRKSGGGKKSPGFDSTRGLAKS